MTYTGEDFHPIDSAEKRFFVKEIERLTPLMDLYGYDVEQEEPEAVDTPEEWSA